MDVASGANDLRVGAEMTNTADEDWLETKRRMANAKCKCGVCAANLYLKIRTERRLREHESPTRGDSMAARNEPKVSE